MKGRKRPKCDFIDEQRTNGAETNWAVLRLRADHGLDGDGSGDSQSGVVTVQIDFAVVRGHVCTGKPSCYSNGSQSYHTESEATHYGGSLSIRISRYANDEHCW